MTTDIVISVENLSKSYHLGQIGTGTLTNDLKVWWARLRGKPNPLLKIGQQDHGNQDGETVWALTDVSFQVEQGEVLGIIGRNGAGKSTLLKLLSRVTAPTKGQVKVKGRIASLLEVGTGFHPELTGRENIYLNGAILGMSKAEVRRKFDEIVAFAEVEKFIDTPVKRYSSGMYVRLAFAVAAHLESEILLVDEVLAVGDAEFQNKCLGKMGDVASREGRTVLFVSHNMTSIQSLCTRCIHIQNGEIFASGSAKHIVERYLESFNLNGAEYKLQSHFIEWLGIMNREDLQSITTQDDIDFQIAFNICFPLHHLQIDLAINNSESQTVIHTKSKFITNGFDFTGPVTKVISYKIYKPQLAPGSYYLTVYIYSDEGILLWIEKISACTVTPDATFGSANYFENIKAAILPRYAIEDIS